ncbi:hypothetical protein P3S67_005533 [Capsicum chacoense]
MVATAILLFVLSGPVKTLNYMLMHGLLGFTMGSVWRIENKLGLPQSSCALLYARAVGALGYVMLPSLLVGVNILALGYIPKKNRIRYSGPLMPPSGNIDEMLKEHEKQIQQAVRKAPLERNKIKNKHMHNGQKESLLHDTSNGR